MSSTLGTDVAETAALRAMARINGRRLLARVFHESVELDRVRIVAGRSGLFGLGNPRPFALGNTVYLKAIDTAALPAILARRAILGSVELVDSVEDARSKWAVPGRHHWVFAEPRLLRAPIEDLDGEHEFWRFTYERSEPGSAGRRRAPVRSGILPAVRVPSAVRMAAKKR